MRKAVGCVACLLALLMVPQVASGQTTPCPQPYMSLTVSTTTPIYVVWCVLQSDNAVGANVYGFGGVPIAIQNQQVLGSYIDAAGVAYYQLRGTVPPAPKGIYQLTVKSINLGTPGDPSTAQEGAASLLPFALTVVGNQSPPSAPGNVYVTK